jgi:hypothetical protein
MELLLSSRGLQNILSNDQKDFTFKVNEQCFKMSKIQAEFLSPSVSKAARLDDTIEEFEISRRGAA